MTVATGPSKVPFKVVDDRKYLGIALSKMGIPWTRRMVHVLAKQGSSQFEQSLMVLEEHQAKDKDGNVNAITIPTLLYGRRPGHHSTPM